MNWTAVHSWLYTGSFLGIHRVAWVGLTVLALLEMVLGRSKNPQLRSVASAVALAMQKAVELTRIAMIPVVGPLVTSVLKAIDGDALVPEAPMPTSQPSASPPPPSDPPKAA
jgi:hypothetical protein